MVTRQKNVRVLPGDKELIERLQELTELSQPEILHKALKLYERHLIALQIKDDFEALAEDPEQLKEYNQMSDIFDTASGDGFVAEP